MTRVVISERFGGFGLSPAGEARYRELSGSEKKYLDDIPRDDLHLIQVVEELGESASGGFADLVVIDVPDDVRWHVHEYDGYETVHEDHRSWHSDGAVENC